MISGIRNTIRELDVREKKTFRLHMLYSLLEGISLGVLALNEFVFVKSLQGSPLQLGFLFQFSMLVFLFLIFLNEFIRRIPRKRLLIRYTALITRAPLILMAVFPRTLENGALDTFWHALFLSLFLIYYLASPIIFPSINLLLKQSYRDENFGKLYSYATSSNKVVMLVITFLYGWLLDVDNFAFTYIYPLIALTGILSGFVLSRIPYVPEDIPARKRIIDAVRDSVSNMVQVLQKNTAYRHFEIGFMLYGFTFMSTVTVITLYFYEGLDLNYFSVAFYRNSYNIGAILLLPLAGKLIGLIGPRRFAVISYSALAMYLVSLIFTDIYPESFYWGSIQVYWALIFYVIFHSVFAATMSLLWNIGSSYFARSEEAGLYQEIHLSLTGFRAIFSPLMGVAFYSMFGFIATFSIGVAILLFAIGFMFWSYKTKDLPFMGRQV